MKTRQLIIIVFVLGFVGTVYASHDESTKDIIHPTYRIPTENPSECWYQEEDGSMTPCKMGDEKSLEWAVMMFLILFWPYIILGITIVTIFMVWRKRK